MRLELKDLRVQYGSGRDALRAVDGVDLVVPEGTAVGLVGESGSGKSTLARAILGLVPAASGSMLVDGAEALAGGPNGVDRLRHRIQMVFQDPYASLNPRMTVGETLGEVLRRHHPRMSRATRVAEVATLLQTVGLIPAHTRLYPASFSGGQRQRIAIARALAVSPELIVADEITSALDVSTQASILNLLRDLQASRGVSVLFISHNLAVVRWVCQLASVMYLGTIVESGSTRTIFERPRHPYTRALVDAVPTLGRAEPMAARLAGDVPDPRFPPSGCRFHTRCPIGPLARPEREICRTTDPDDAGSGDHRTFCHFPLADGEGIPIPSGVHEEVEGPC